MSARLPAPDAVVFDMDGLLLDSERLCMAIFANVVAAHGFVFDRAVYGRCIGTTRDGTRAVLRDGYGDAFPLDAIERDWMERYESRVLGAPVPVKAGARELLEGLRERGVPCGLATSTRRAVAARKLELTGLAKYFRVQVTGDEVRRGKPDPEPYLEAVRRLAVAAPRSWALEDSDNGVRAAHAAGLNVVQVPDLTPPADAVLALGHRVVESLDAVRALLDEPPSRAET